MHVHFDEQKFERDLRAAFDQMTADPALHDVGSVVLDRNRDLSVQYGMMVCRELNRGTELSDIMSAGVSAFTEFFVNMLQYCDEDDHILLAKTVIADVASQMSGGVAGVGFEEGVPATMQEVQGGHA